MASSVATKNKITLKGSAKIVTEFFHYAVNRRVRAPLTLIALCCLVCRGLAATPRLCPPPSAASALRPLPFATIAAPVALLTRLAARTALRLPAAAAAAAAAAVSLPAASCTSGACTPRRPLAPASSTACR